MKVEETRTKAQILEDYLDISLATIDFDPQALGVIVPAVFKTDGIMRLNLSWNFKDSNMLITEDRVEATLTFKGAPFRCYVPMHAIFAISSKTVGNGKVFPEAMPAQARANFFAQLMAEKPVEEVQGVATETARLEGLKFDEPMVAKPFAVIPGGKPRFQVIKGGKS
jgi:stringent starvation protein B